ncbi:AMP-binding protein [Aerolutibacter ruishenii]|uniref:Acyl-coenzyme A synthetase/AMP-(Fatty) acid ligase n=1 Tax=Aerolutibacter ruishenii TaxID=686800 RepID=A0A562M046_9GAMM|nr:AMP-binding protein [Lysobacter ruishenii]TWI13315.1 acyl-coenzyme A synthetase/AMP-(fatty) acid ligase [Lysobacter ruishenii]
MAEWIALAEVAARPVPGRVVALGAGSCLDHVGFRAEAARWRDAFTARGGERWALHFDDTAAFAAALFGAWHAGKTVCLCADALPVTVARLEAGVDGFAGDFPEACAAIALHTQANSALTGTAPPADAVGASDADSAWMPLDEQATRLVVYTSGSTGEAAAIDKRLAQLVREVEALQATFGERLDGAVVHGTVSHQHIYGLLFRVLWPLAAGRAIAPRLFFHEEIAAAMDAPALLVSSPAHLKRIPEALDWNGARTRLRAVFSSGGALPAEAATAAHAMLGHAPIEIYGSSETGGIAWRQHDTDGPAWTPLPGVDWRIADGQLEVASPHLPDAAWWRSADRVEADGTAGFRLLGRADRIVKVEERRVSLTALERQLGERPEVAEARVVLVEGPRAELAAVVVLTGEGQARLRADGRRRVAQSLGQALADGQDAVTRPRRWRFVDALPGNAQGKTTDAALRALFRPERPAPVWVRCDATQAQLELALDADLLVFDGHFPRMPILPGVAQLDWAVRFGREAFALPPRFLRTEALKFQRVARPGMRIHLHLEWLEAKSVLAFRYESELGTHASGRVVLGPAEATA